MTRFKDFFEKSAVYPREALYKNKKIIEVDKFPISNGETLIISIEKTNSKYTQGVTVGIYGFCKVKGKTHKSNKKLTDMLFWEDAELVDPKHIEIQIFTKKSFVFIQNIWEAEDSSPVGIKKGLIPCYVGTAFYKSPNWAGSAMDVEEIEGGKSYFCSDGDSNDSFDNIIFTVQRLKSS